MACREIVIDNKDAQHHIDEFCKDENQYAEYRGLEWLLHKNCEYCAIKEIEKNIFLYCQDKRSPNRHKVTILFKYDAIKVYLLDFNYKS